MPNNFAIVKFLLTDEVAVLPVTWLSTKGCVWPPLKAYEVMKLVMKLTKPSPDWICHEAKLLGEYGAVRRNPSIQDIATDHEIEKFMKNGMQKARNVSSLKNFKL